MAENLERSIFMKADDLPDYFDNIQRYVRGFKSRIAVKKNEGKDSEAGPSTKIEANDRWRIICANVYDELLELKMKNMILSKMVTEILQSDERPVKELIQGQINRLKGMLGLDRVLRFHYLELLSLPNDQMVNVISTIRSWARPGYRSFFTPVEMKPFEIQVPGEALFIPVEKMLLVCQDELPFEGFFIDNRNQSGTFKRWKMEFHITLFPFVTGLGADDVGEFRWISRQRVINPERIRFIKEYTTHEVHYSGYLRGGVLFGTWYLPDDEDSFGRFAMWPKNYKNILEMNLKKMTKSEYERNELEKKLIFVGNGFEGPCTFLYDL